MRCLSDSIRHTASSGQPLLRAVEDARSLTEFILAAWQVARVLAVQLVEAVLAERTGRVTSWPPCPLGGTSLHSKGFIKRQVTRLWGPLQWRRRVGQCPQGGAIPQVAPLDEALGVPRHQRRSGELPALGCALAVCVPFATAARWLGGYSGGGVSPRAVWWWVQAAGHQAMEPLQADLATRAQGHEPTPEPLTAALAILPLVLGADGVMVPFRSEGGHPRGKSRWREIKGGVLARWGQHRTRTGHLVTRLHQRRLGAVLGDIEMLTPRRWRAALRQGIRRTPQVVWLSEGGRGLWRLFAEQLARYATGVLDFDHAAQHLWKSAAAWLDGRTTQARRWFGWARHRLRPGQPDGVLADLAEAWEVEGLPATARATVATARATVATVDAYLARHRDHIDYEVYKERGLPLGSGMVESACTWLIQQRFKGVGMRWSEDGFNPLLHLRLAWVNGSFEALFEVQLQPSPNT